VEKLNKERIEEIERQAGEPVKFWHLPFGTVVVKQPHEAAFVAYMRGQRQALTGKREIHDVQKNLVSACVVYPTAVELSQAIDKSKLWGLWQQIADVLWDWCNGSGDLEAQSLGND
jgi:hypothetical protein